MRERRKIVFPAFTAYNIYTYMKALVFCFPKKTNSFFVYESHWLYLIRSPFAFEQKIACWPKLFHHTKVLVEQKNVFLVSVTNTALKRSRLLLEVKPIDFETNKSLVCFFFVLKNHHIAKMLPKIAQKCVFG